MNLQNPVSSTFPKEMLHSAQTKPPGTRFGSG
jgi:hypothetical protein